MPPLLQLHFLVVLLAATAILGRLISLPAPALVTWRTLLAAIGAAIFMKLVRKRPLRVPAKQLAGLLGIGAIIGLHWVCFFGAIQLSNISISLAGMATISLFTAFTEPLLEKRAIRPLEVGLGLLIVAGLAMVAGFERGHWLGLLVALGAAFLASIFPVLNRRVVNTSGLDTQAMVAWEMLGANVTVLVLVLLPVLTGHLSDPATAYRDLFAFHGLDWLWLLVLAWACTVFAHGFHIHLLRSLSAYTSNLAINFEPVYGILAAGLMFGEFKDLHAGFYAGTVTIVAANLLHALVPVWRRKRGVE
ncbi:DMT family transporter [Luteolibacter ambystomatis]|uniref:DMT family transporter n=1 Tax=Luteolibacter ambystomatis TaxID=2824561 RepID=A0A975IXX4_9BACT|nr:DMT family transporter [Luteolibacter ambystomatis]QUE49786.1 DMT family transporter [Luteolibacter ambystomatis]